MRVHRGPYRGGAGDVHVCRGTVREPALVAVGDDLVVHAEALDEGHVGGRGQPDHRDAVPAGGLVGHAERRLGRCTGDDHVVGAEVAVVGQEVVDQERGEEQGVEHHLAVLADGAGCHPRVREGVAVVGAGHGGAVGRAVHDAAVVDPAHRDHQLLRHGQEAVDPGPRGDVVVARLHHLCEPPHRHPPPRVLCGEEVPVLEHVADHGVGDVVGGEGERLDPEPGLPLVQRCGGDVHHPRPVEVRAVDLQVHVLLLLACDGVAVDGRVDLHDRGAACPLSSAG